MDQKAGGVEFNRPTLVAVLYLMTWFTGLTALVGVILAYIWRKEAETEWEQSHWTYLINTFWIGLAGLVVVLALILIGVVGDNPRFDGIEGVSGACIIAGVVIVPTTLIMLLVRCIRVLVNAQANRPMPKPHTLVF